MSSAPTLPIQLTPPPPGYRWIAWQGIALLVPATWDLGKHQGDQLHGSIRLDGDGGVRLQLRWMPARAMPDPLSAAEQLAAARRDELKETAISVYPLELPTPAPPVSASAAVSRVIQGVTREIVIAVTAPAVNRALLLRLPMHEDWPDRAIVQTIVQSLKIYSQDSAWPWDFFDLQVVAPAKFSLKEASLSVGVCQLKFTCKRRYLTLRRFSAATAALGRFEPDEAAVELWFRAIYARDFHDMNYQVHRLRQSANDVRSWLLTTLRRRKVALELGWILPQHRHPPRAIVIQWHRTLNKIACFEFDRPVPETDPSLWPKTLREFVDSWRTQLPDAKTTSALARPPEPESRRRSLEALVTPAPDVKVTTRPTGQLTLAVQIKQPSSLGWLRVLAGQPAGSQVQLRQFDLDLLGTEIWQAIAARPTPVAELIERIRQRFSVTAHEAERAVIEFVRALGQRNLVVIQTNLPTIGEQAPDDLA